jgi:predicted transposase/invertase (TIGR01784 family)
MFKGVLDESLETGVMKLTEVKSMLAQLIEKIEKRAEERGEKRAEERGEKRAEERGEERGEKRGLKKAFQEIAKIMKSKGYPSAEIVEITGLSAEEIEKL